MRRIVVIVIVASCTRAEHREAREKYDQGVDLMTKGDFDGAEKALIEARAEAGVDPELRFRAAYDLGVAYAAHADKTKTGENADLAKALELEQEAVSWFFDAQRLRKDDADTKANLAVARARAQAISDKLREGENKLEARLDAAIKDEREVLDDARGAWLAIKQAHGADPLAQQGTLVHLADKERGILAETGVIGDLAGDEIDKIGKKAEDKRTDEEKVRVVQLKNLDMYLMDGRTRVGEARKKLQELAAEDGVARAEAALIALKRAREQLLDPITVLREIFSDQLELATQEQAPSPTSQADRENTLRDRLEEIRARLQAAVANQDKAKDEEKKLLERIAAALPHVGAASEGMEKARVAFNANNAKDAAGGQHEAIKELGKAIEEFADLKSMIDLTAETQHQVVSLLDQKSNDAVDELAQNVARMARIKDLLAEEAAKKPKDDKQAEAMKQQLAAAEVLRAEAEKALLATQAAIKANKDPGTPAKLAADKLDELRRLFFSVIEHLQDLIRRQGETKDKTSEANADDDFARAPKLPAIASRETEHAQMAKAITDALAKQADAAGKQQQPGQDPQGPSTKQLAGAADEVRLAQNDMADANVTLDKAQKAQQSVSLKPAVDSEGKALEHLENALKLLQPPPKQQQDKDKNKQQQQQQQQPQQPQPQQQPQGGAGQRARDEDAKRQRERRQHESGNDPVDQDW
jgi:hypothetical protein